MAPRRRRRPQQRPKTPPIPQPVPGQQLRRSPRLVVTTCSDDHLCGTRLRRTTSEPQLQQQAQQPRKRKKQQLQQPRPPLPAPSSSSEDDDSATTATPRRKRKEIANIQVQPAKRLRTRPVPPPPCRSSPRSRKNVLLVVAPRRSSPEPAATSPFSLLAQRAPLDMIDLGPTLLSDCSKDDTTSSWTSPPSPLTPLSTAPPSPTSPTSAATDEKEASKPLLPSDDSMDVDDAAPRSRSPDKPAESVHIPQEAQGPGQQHDDAPQGSLSSSSSPTTPLSSLPLSQGSLQAQPAQQQHQFQQQLPLQAQPLQPLLQSQFQAPQQQPSSPYTWYDLQQQESQQQILHWEEPPRLDLIKNVWKFACKYRVWDVMCRYTPHIIRSVVAQEATDYHTQYGYPSGQFHYRMRCRTSKRGGYLSSKRRRLDPDSEPDKDKEGKKNPPSRHVTPENAMDLDGVEPGVSPSPEREKFMDEEYYDWEIRSDGEEDDDDGNEVFYYEEYDEDDECFDEEETDSEEEEEEEGEDVSEAEEEGSVERKRRSRASSPLGTATSLHKRKKSSSDVGMDVDSDSNPSRRKPRQEDEEREGEDGEENRAEEEDDPSFNAELTLSCSPTSPTAGGCPLVVSDGPGCDQSLSVSASSAQAQASSTPLSSTAANSGAASAAAIITDPSQVPQQQQQCTKGALMSMFYCPPLPQVRQQPQQTPMQVCQPPQHQNAFALDAAQIRPPTPAPQSPSSPVFGMQSSTVPTTPTTPCTATGPPATGVTTTATATIPSTATPPQIALPMSIPMSPMSPIPLPPPRLNSIRVRPLRYGDLGLASVIGKGTPVDRSRAGIWARAGKIPDDKGPVPGPSIVPSSGATSVTGGASSNVGGSEPQVKTQSIPTQATSDRDNNKMTFEPDQSIWDAFFATLQGDSAEMKQKQEQGQDGGGVATAGGSVGSSGGESVVSTSLTIQTGSGTTTGAGTGVNPVLSATAAGTTPGAAASSTAASASAGTTMNVFGFGLGLGMGFVSGSVNHVALGFGGSGGAGTVLDHSVPWASVPSSPGASSSSNSASSSSSPAPSTIIPPAPPLASANVNSLYSADLDMSGSHGSVQTYLSLPMGMGVGMGMSMSMGMGMGVGVPVPMGMSGMGVGMGVPLSMSAGGAQVGVLSHSHSLGSAGVSVSGAPAGVQAASVPATAAAAVGPGSSALSYALG